MSKDYEVNCPECGRRAFPTNFPAYAFGGKRNDKRTVWFCSDMGHCVFTPEEKKKKNTGCDECDKLSGKTICIDCQIEQADHDVVVAMSRLEELKKLKERKRNEKLRQVQGHEIHPKE